MPLPGTTESREAFPSCVNFFGDAPPVPPKGQATPTPFGTKCPSLAFALDNQDILHNYVQESVIFTTKLDGLTLLLFISGRYF
ncbi:MAG: hypothetical protein HRU34_08390 [Richelia sp.]|nr:hypothetical protein [Richelia sp.]